MPASGGLTPYTKENALVGPARVLWAPTSVAVPGDLYDIVPAVADTNGEYPALTGWNDFGLAADAPSYTHDKDVEGLQYEQPRGDLFEQVTDIDREFTAQIAEISPENLAIVENSSQTVTTIAASKNEAAQKKLAFGSYSSFTRYRIALLSLRPTGAGEVKEPAPSNRVRPPWVGLILPQCALAAEKSELEFSREDPVNAEVTFKVFPESTLASGAEHGFWIFEQAGTISAS